MTDMTGISTPSAALITAYKYAANANSSVNTAQNQADSFGPAVITPTPKLSGAAISAINETAQNTAHPVAQVQPNLSNYDSSGRSQGSNP
ncbi:MAG: hypothetical protein Q7T44_17130 [Parvibaculum sp.]|nr:hypothetical protein [Parvibaculum sp.]